MGISLPDPVILSVTNVPDGESVVNVNVNPLKPEQGIRVMRRSNKVINRLHF